jgi:S-adenosylmethionine:tRNA-ribosyltransferase-isomerase (queuine synthetase)
MFISALYNIQIVSFVFSNFAKPKDYFCVVTHFGNKDRIIQNYKKPVNFSSYYTYHQI